MKRQRVKQGQHPDQWIMDLCQWHMDQAMGGTWDGKTMTPYYCECRKLDVKNGITTVVVRDVGSFTGHDFIAASLQRCFNLSVASFSPVNMMPERTREEIAVRIVKRFFWPHAGRVFVKAPVRSGDLASDIWHYVLFCDESWLAQPLTEGERKLIEESGLIPFNKIQERFANAG
jgi:hypothetical protein